MVVITKFVFYYAEGHHTGFTVSPTPISPKLLTWVHILAEDQVPSKQKSLIRESGSWERLSSCRVDQGGISPDVQGRTLFLVSAYALSSGSHRF